MLVIEFVNECSSTQKELIYLLKKCTIKPPYALVSKYQTNGVGSRDNSWDGEVGNLYFSFCVYDDFIPKDVPAQSLSIYFAYLMNIFLENEGSNLWLKWPNDFYLNDKKIGGVITNKFKNIYICGMGINLTNSPHNGDVLDVNIDIKSIVMGFIEILEKKFLWKQIFSKFLVEFEKSRSFYSHIDNESIFLGNALLCEDGSIIVNNKKVYSLR